MLDSFEKSPFESINLLPKDDKLIVGVEFESLSIPKRPEAEKRMSSSSVTKDSKFSNLENIELYFFDS